MENSKKWKKRRSLETFLFIFGLIFFSYPLAQGQEFSGQINAQREGNSWILTAEATSPKKRIIEYEFFVFNNNKKNKVNLKQKGEVLLEKGVKKVLAKTSLSVSIHCDAHLKIMSNERILFEDKFVCEIE